MLLVEVSEHPLFWMVKRLLDKGVIIDVLISPVSHVVTDIGPVEVSLCPQALMPDSADRLPIDGRLVNIEHRGAALSEPTVVLRVSRDGDDDWHYIFEWALEHLQLKRATNGFLLTNKKM